jgi:Nas2 N_terminal domain
MDDDLKSRLKELMENRELLEVEIEAATSRLAAAGVGMHGPLVDHEVRRMRKSGLDC